MFGEVLMFGQTICNVCTKKRLYLPPKTKREEGEVVYLVYDNYINEYKIVPYATIENEFKNYEDLIKSAKSAAELKQYKLLLNNFAYSIKKECKVDGQGRISLLEDFIQEEKITIVGAGNHLVLKREKNNKK